MVLALAFCAALIVSDHVLRPVNPTALRRAVPLATAAASAEQIFAPFATFSFAASSWAAMLNAGSLAIFFPLSMVDLSRIATAGAHVLTVKTLLSAIPPVLASTWSRRNV